MSLTGELDLQGDTAGHGIRTKRVNDRIRLGQPHSKVVIIGEPSDVLGAEIHFRAALRPKGIDPVTVSRVRGKDPIRDCVLCRCQLAAPMDCRIIPTAHDSDFVIIGA